MTAIVSIKHPDPRFEGQTKTKLDNPDASKAVGKVTGEEIVRYFDRNLDTLKTVLSSAEKAAKIRKTEEKAKTNLLTKQKYSFDSNGKLANCESRDPKKCEIFIVEGDSAGGSAKTARDRNFQAILPIRGKILNVEKASIDKILANAEIKTMINAFGCGFSEGYGNDFDITKLRYDKIIIMADADVDGAHISTLLLTLFYRFMPELIYEGHVYIAMPPLYKAMPKTGRKNTSTTTRHWRSTGKPTRARSPSRDTKVSARWTRTALGDYTRSGTKASEAGGDRGRKDGVQRDGDAHGYRSAAEARVHL